MSKKFKTQASSGRAAGGFGAFSTSTFASGHSSTLSYIQETPDYSGISDANTVVAFKNLSKKDGTTKAKALEDLATYVSLGDTEIEEGVLETWVKLYPRLSIDSARRVRQLAQILNAEILLRCGKRSLKHLPRISGPWLASSYDNDRAVAKAAQEALSRVFSNPEKITGLKKAFQANILEYCRDALLHETVKTLSDERSVTADDAEAIYARVLASSLTVVADLLNSLSPEESAKQQHIHEEILDHQQTWMLVAHTDASVRRAMHRVVQTYLESLPNLVSSRASAVSTAYVYKGLASDQTGSSLGYVQALNLLTRSIPQIWTGAYSGKKSAASRFRNLVRNGSCSGPSESWNLLGTLFTIIPGEVLPTSYEEAAELLTAAREGVTKKDERLNAPTAWPAYFVLTNIVSKHLPSDDCERVLERMIFPIFRQYLQPSSETADWSIPHAKAAVIVSQAAQFDKMSPLLESTWSDLGNKLVESAKMSQPQQSKDFEKSQLQVSSSGERWANLQKALFSIPTAPNTLMTAYASTNVKILDDCIALLQSREGKPYGTAAVIEEIVRKCGSFLLQDASFKSTLSKFILHDVPSLIVTTPSRRHLTLCLLAIKDEPIFDTAYTETLRKLFESDQPRDIIFAAIHDLLPQNAPPKAIAIAKADGHFQSFASSLVNREDSVLFSDLLNLGVLTTETVDGMLSKLTASIVVSEPSKSAVYALETISRTSQSTVQAFMAKSDPMGEQLLPGVIRLEQSSDEDIANKASVLASRLSSAIGETGTEARFGVIMRGLQSIGPQSPSIDTLQDLTSRVLDLEKASITHLENPLDVLPDLEMWAGALIAAVEPPSPSLAIVSPLGSAVRLIACEGARERTSHIPLDREGLSQALRIAIYVAWLLCETDLLDQLRSRIETKPKLFVLLYLTVLLTEDNLSVVGVNNLWHPQANHEVEPSIMDFLTNANTSLGKYWQEMTPILSLNSDNPSDYSRFIEGLESFHSEHGARPALSYYHALALVKANANLFELHGYDSQSSRTSEELLKRSRSRKDALHTMTCMVGLQLPLGSTPTLIRYCNELVADLTGLEIADSQKASKGLEQLILLNTILYSQDDVIENVAKQRLIFLVKHLIQILTSEADSVIAAEIGKMLSVLLPSIHDVYGEHWSQILSYLTSSWSLTGSVPAKADTDEEVLLMNATLKLYHTIQKLLKLAEPNDDLLDAQKEHEVQIYESLIHLLKSRTEIADEEHQPLQVTHELLARQIAQLPPKPLKAVHELYSLLYAPSRAIQQATFDLLHKDIPVAQEQVSFDAALENKSARLPDELLSLLLEAPTLDSLADALFVRVMPRPLQGYLYSWRLMFDHFNGSSYRVKNDYIEQLKDGAYLGGLLSLTFDFLGHTRGRPVDASKFDIQNYTPDVELSPEKDVQWLLIHLYYLALFNLPSSVKSYYLDVRSRQTSQAIDSWTAKYISPVIVNASLQAVAEWSEKSIKEDPEYEKMSVKVGMKSKEITVSYIVDEQTMAIKVVLPEAYPLAAAQVLSINRVAVKEEKWQSWLRNCQGVIIFSNGSIIDGLSAWRKNVTGALKGQTECAICYSIISGDKQLPTKRCPTCKHLFHGSCLHKWFKTSNASTCPLCRNPFSFN